MIEHAPYHVVQHCRSCGHPGLSLVTAFGTTPIADRVVEPGDTAPQYVAPLTLLHCDGCGLCQIAETVEPRVLFGAGYPYYSSVSPVLSEHFTASAEALIDRFALGPGDLVIEAASNDGYMLKTFASRGVGVLGIDPADGPVRVAREKGIETVHDFFGSDLARSLAGQGRRAKLFLANNILAHVANVNDFVEGIGVLLADDGTAVIELPYLFDLLDNCAFDTIYHQHLLYVSATALVPLFARHGLYLNDIERLWVHGGSLRLYVSRENTASARLTALLAQEAARKVGSIALYDPFLTRINRLRESTRATLDSLRAQGLQVVGYGAAAKATTLMHVFGLGRSDLEVIYDRSPWKHGLTMPGTGVPIVSADRILTDMPGAILLLAWNFADEIIADNAAYLEAGGRFIVPLPDLRVLPGAENRRVS